MAKKKLSKEFQKTFLVILIIAVVIVGILKLKNPNLGKGLGLIINSSTPSPTPMPVPTPMVSWVEPQTIKAGDLFNINGSNFVNQGIAQIKEVDVGGRSVNFNIATPSLIVGGPIDDSFGLSISDQNSFDVTVIDLQGNKYTIPGALSVRRH